MSEIDSIQSEETQLSTDLGALGSAISSQVADVAAEVAKLQSQVPDPTVLAGVQSSLQALDSTVTQLTSQVGASDPGAPAAAASTTASVGGAAPVATDPTSPTSTDPATSSASSSSVSSPSSADSASPSTGDTTVDPTATSGSTSGTEPSASSTTSTTSPEPPRTVYTTTDSIVDASLWPAAPVVESPSGTALYYFSGDSQNADGSWTQNGANEPGWTVYTGATMDATTGAPATATTDSGIGTAEPNVVTPQDPPQVQQF